MSRSFGSYTPIVSGTKVWNHIKHWRWVAWFSERLSAIARVGTL